MSCHLRAGGIGEVEAAERLAAADAAARVGHQHGESGRGEDLGPGHRPGVVKGDAGTAVDVDDERRRGCRSRLGARQHQQPLDLQAILAVPAHLVHLDVALSRVEVER